MFGVRLQNMARKAGLRSAYLRRDTATEGARLLVVDLSAGGDWVHAIEAARSHNVDVVAFGPHMDAESRRKAKEAGASRVIANSNLERDLPIIFGKLRDKS